MNGAITFDIDWAPDCAIAQCAEICVLHRVPATFFVTHDSPLVRSLATEPLFELGIHPNFAPGSSQGATTREVIEFCLDLVPDARSFRTHMLIQSSPLLTEIRALAPQLQYDVSLYLHMHRGLLPTPFRLDRATPPLWRLPYFWEDDVAAADPDWRWDGPAPAGDGLRIFDFHPILVALNVADIGLYGSFKSAMAGRPMVGVLSQEIAALRHPGVGDCDFLERLARQGRPFARIADLAMQLTEQRPVECV